ncbi:MAG TPA: hypothetical protein VHN36_03755, partial [Ilumatobacteraceae bacterium]|nr:hypothetical protein [Ilumatobacteraceae bacterium]
MRSSPTLRRGKIQVIGLFFTAVVLLGTTLGFVSTTPVSAATPTFVQTRANEIIAGTTNSLAFSSANTAGNLIVVYVLWSNAGAVTVSDSKGNAYSNVGTATRWNNNAWSSQVFYAKNVLGGANTVKAVFGTSINSFGIIYIHEYSGMDKVNPLDVNAAAIGSGSAMNSGSATTTNGNDLIFGAAGSISTVTQVGTGFTSRSTSYANRTEDKKVSTTGSYNATATQNGSAWVMHMVAFRADAGTPDTTAPSIPTGLTATS